MLLRLRTLVMMTVMMTMMVVMAMRLALSSAQVIVFVTVVIPRRVEMLGRATIAAVAAALATVVIVVVGMRRRLGSSRADVRDRIAHKVAVVIHVCAATPRYR